MNREAVEYIYHWLLKEYDCRELGAPDSKIMGEVLSEWELELEAAGKNALRQYIHIQTAFYSGTIMQLAKEEQRERRRVRDTEMRKLSYGERCDIALELAVRYCMEVEYRLICNSHEEKAYIEVLEGIKELAEMGHYKSGLQFAEALIDLEHPAEAAELLQKMIQRKPDKTAYMQRGKRTKVYISGVDGILSATTAPERISRLSAFKICYGR